ncbi:BQ2448_4619 [Microbotryum intermedium]|uniref:BQ2448_4619 protein n=1 Tax=Microbotryum intermedium TaxID=269621 RepID=A0A238FFF0_9BASI|nr:BQ2448_4619 [Microbotryum intermedium]
MILGIGVDLLHLPRLSSLITRRGADRFARRILTPFELEQWRKIDKDQLQRPLGEVTKGDLVPETRRTTYLAVRWAAKEAAYKALHSSRRIASWQDVQIEKLEGCRPSLKLLNRKSGSRPSEETGSSPAGPETSSTSPSSTIPRLHLSLSHDGEYVVAYVVAEEGSSG